MLQLRQLILDAARETEGVGELEETLRWGEPSYLTSRSKSGSIVRIDSRSLETCAMYFHCQTNLISRFKSLYPDELEYVGNRAIVFHVDDPIPEAELRHCIALALTYHLDKKRR